MIVWCQVCRSFRVSDSLCILVDADIRRSGAFEPSQQPVDSGVRHLRDEVLVDQDVARLEIPVDQRRRQGVQVIQTCNSEFRLQKLCLRNTLLIFQCINHH